MIKLVISVKDESALTLSVESNTRIITGINNGSVHNVSYPPKMLPVNNKIKAKEIMFNIILSEFFLFCDFFFRVAIGICFFEKTEKNNAPKIKLGNESIKTASIFSVSANCSVLIRSVKCLTSEMFEFNSLLDIIPTIVTKTNKN